MTNVHDIELHKDIKYMQSITQSHVLI